MKTLSAILTLVSVAIFLFGVLAIFRPRILKLRKRRHAAAVAGAAFPLLGIAVDLAPPPGQTDSGFVMFGLLYAALFAGAWGVFRVTASLSNKPDTALNPRLSARDQAPLKLGPRPSNPDPLSPLDAETRAKVESEIAAIHRMSEANKAAKATSPARPQWGQVVSSGLDAEPADDNEDFYSASGQGEWGTILRRGSDGRSLTFEYISNHGELTDRTLHNWVEYPRHIQGICGAARAVRCFRKDRVSEWYEGSDKMLRAPKGKSRQ